MQGWFITGDEAALADIAWWDEHGTDKQRGYQIACLLYGADATRFKAIADKADLPESRRESCVDESEKNSKTWEEILGPLQFANGEEPKEKPVTVIYTGAADYQTEQDYLKKLGLLDDLASLMNRTYKFKSGITVGAEQCGEANAFWNPGQRKLTICYELVRDFLEIAEKYKE